jgi:hypothetical protein
MHDSKHNREYPKLPLLVAHLSEKGYTREVVISYASVARQFLRYVRHIPHGEDSQQDDRQEPRFQAYFQDVVMGMVGERVNHGVAWPLIHSVDRNPALVSRVKIGQSQLI